ncbi:MAG TPA: aspartate kinase [Drouetiella sp.]
MGRLVQKFGGATVADLGRIRKAAEIAVKQAVDGNEVVAVVSAMGRTTDRLKSMANQLSDKPNARELDMLLATGEQMSGALLTMAIQSLGYQARSFTGSQAGIVTEHKHGMANIRDVHPEAVEACLGRGEIAVVAGFQGMTENAEITTLGPGGSDTTAVALTAALAAERCDIYSDVRGVFTADPHIVDDARCLPALSYEEMLELTSSGAELLSPTSLELALDTHIPIRVRASHNPDDLGTLITHKWVAPDYAICAVAVDRNHASLKLTTTTPGAQTLEGVSNLFTRLQELNISTDMMMLLAREDEPTQELALTVDRRAISRVKTIIESLSDSLGTPKVSFDTSSARISVIGRHLTSRTDIVAGVFETLHSASIPVQLVATGDMRVTVLLPDQHAAEAVKLLHNRFKLSDGNSSV